MMTTETSFASVLANKCFMAFTQSLHSCEELLLSRRSTMLFETMITSPALRSPIVWSTIFDWVSRLSLVALLSIDLACLLGAAVEWTYMSWMVNSCCFCRVSARPDKCPAKLSPMIAIFLFLFCACEHFWSISINGGHWPFSQLHALWEICVPSTLPRLIAFMLEL